MPEQLPEQNAADLLTRPSTQEIAVTMRLFRAPPVQFQLRPEQFHDASGRGRDHAQIVGQQTQHARDRKRVKAGRVPDQHAGDPATVEGYLHAPEAEGILEHGTEHEIDGPAARLRIGKSRPEQWACIESGAQHDGGFAQLCRREGGRAPDLEGLRSLAGRQRNRFNQPMHRLGAPIAPDQGRDNRGGRVRLQTRGARAGTDLSRYAGLPANIVPGRHVYRLVRIGNVRRSVSCFGLEVPRHAPRQMLAEPGSVALDQPTVSNGNLLPLTLMIARARRWAEDSGQATLIRPGPAAGVASRSANMSTGAGGESR